MINVVLITLTWLDVGDIKFYDFNHSNSAYNRVKIGLNSGIIY